MQLVFWGTEKIKLHGFELCQAVPAGPRAKENSPLFTIVHLASTQQCLDCLRSL